MNVAFISLGSNLGDRKSMIVQALERISFANKVVAVSDLYETFAQHGISKDPYLNICAEIRTDMKSNQLMQFLIETERQLSGPYNDKGAYQVHLDCDLISFEDEIIRTPQLTLPHPEAHRRAYMMIPLAQLRPDWIHPILHRKASELAQEAFWEGWGSFYAHGKSLLDF